MEVNGLFSTLTNSNNKSIWKSKIHNRLGTIKDESIVFQKDIDFKQLKATMEAAKKAEEQIQKTGELAYQQVVIGFVRMGWWCSGPAMAKQAALLTLGFQIVSFLGKDRMVEFLGLKTNEERISFMYRHEAYRPLLQVLLKYIWS